MREKFSPETKIEPESSKEINNAKASKNESILEGDKEQRNKQETISFKERERINVELFSKTDLGKYLQNYKGKEIDESFQVELVEQIKTTSQEDYELLLDNLSGLEQKEEFSGEAIRAILERGFEQYESLIQQANDEVKSLPEEDRITARAHDKRIDDAFRLAAKFGGIYQFKDKGGISDSKEEITNKVFSEFAQLAKEYPTASSMFWITFSLKMHEVKPSTLIDWIADMQWRPETSSSMKRQFTDNLNILGYRNKEEGERYRDAILSNLEFKKPENYFKTGVFLELIKNAYKFERIYYDEPKESPLENSIEEDNEMLKEYEVIHQTGEKNYSQVKKEAKIVVKPEQEPFYHPMPFFKENQLRHAYAAADFIVNRAGSGSIFEIAALKKPSILVPLAHAAQNHQVANAYAYANTKASVVLEEANLTPHFFLEKIRYLMKHPSEIKEMEEKASAFSKPEAAQKVAEHILRYFEK